MSYLLSPATASFLRCFQPDIATGGISLPDPESYGKDPATYSALKLDPKALKEQGFEAYRSPTTREDVEELHRLGGRYAVESMTVFTLRPPLNALRVVGMVEDVVAEARAVTGAGPARPSGGMRLGYLNDTGYLVSVKDGCVELHKPDGPSLVFESDEDRIGEGVIGVGFRSDTAAAHQSVRFSAQGARTDEYTFEFRGAGVSALHVYARDLLGFESLSLQDLAFALAEEIFASSPKREGARLNKITENGGVGYAMAPDLSVVWTTSRFASFRVRLANLSGGLMPVGVTAAALWDGAILCQKA